MTAGQASGRRPAGNYWVVCHIGWTRGVVINGAVRQGQSVPEGKNFINMGYSVFVIFFLDRDTELGTPVKYEKDITKAH